jgi:hypothetical protein
MGHSHTHTLTHSRFTLTSFYDGRRTENTSSIQPPPPCKQKGLTSFLPFLFLNSDVFFMIDGLENVVCRYENAVCRYENAVCGEESWLLESDTVINSDVIMYLMLRI